LQQYAEHLPVQQFVSGLAVERFPAYVFPVAARVDAERARSPFKQRQKHSMVPGTEALGLLHACWHHGKPPFGVAVGSGCGVVVQAIGRAPGFLSTGGLQLPGTVVKVEW
jgi:hypothetical protein